MSEHPKDETVPVDALNAEPFITLDNIAVRLRDRLFLQNTSWKVNSNEHWAVLGPNGAGKSTLVKSLFGAIPVVRGSITFHFIDSRPDSPAAASARIGYVSSELHRRVFDREKLKDSFRDFSGDADGVTTMKEMILEGGSGDRETDPLLEERLKQTCRRLQVDDLLLRDIKSLSTGEISKALIVKALLRRPGLLILDEPFEGLDRPARKTLSDWINELMRGPARVILVTHRLEEIVPNITHVLFLKNGAVFDCGRREDTLVAEKVRQVYDIGALKSRRGADTAERVSELAQNSRRLKGSPGAEKVPVLVDMRKVNVSVGGNQVLKGFSWVMRSGENWAISGPIGAGKTTVLKLITGENLQAYANEIYLFGSRRGHGDSIWDIKKRIGYISSELQNRHPHHQTALAIVCSGYFGTLGLYRRCADDLVRIAEKWMEIVGIADLAGHYFGRLSHGQKQLVLIARAMVASPLLLILDEPCAGLDIANRGRIMNVLELIGRHTATDLLYVPDHDEEMLACITHILRINAGRVEACIRK